MVHNRKGEIAPWCRLFFCLLGDAWVGRRQGGVLMVPAQGRCL